MLRLQQPGFTTIVSAAGESVQVADGYLTELGGVIINPQRAVDQGIMYAESLFVSLIGPARTIVDAYTSELVPGQWFLVPPGANAWVNAKTLGHKFTAFFTTSYKVPPAKPVPGDPASDVPSLGAEPGTQNFPPRNVTGLTEVLPSYLYQQYTDDDDLQGFVEAQNEMQQNYVDTFNALNLPIYTGPIVSGKLLDWVGRGLYGMARPILGSDVMNLMGPLNTYGPNWLVPMWDFPNFKLPQGDWQVAANIPDLNPYAANPFEGYWWNAVTANPSVAETAPSSLPGIGGNLINDGDKILWDAQREVYIQTTSAAVEANFGLNMIGLYGNINLYLTDDDVYRRILSWHFFKQDGNYCSTEFIKRRVWRFLYGVDGKHWDFIDPTLGAAHPSDRWPGSFADPDDAFIADRKQISITFGVNRNVTIRFVLGDRNVNLPVGGAMCNGFGCNGFEPAWGTSQAWDIGVDKASPMGPPGPKGIYLNDLETTYVSYPPLPFMTIFKQALDLGVLELPYQFNWTCHIG
jgi:hypothetical protein